MANGARAVLWEPAPVAVVPDLPSDIVVAPVSHLRELASEIANRFFEHGRFNGTETEHCRNSKISLLEGVLDHARRA